MKPSPGNPLQCEWSEDGAGQSGRREEDCAPEIDEAGPQVDDGPGQAVDGYERQGRPGRNVGLVIEEGEEDGDDYEAAACSHHHAVGPRSEAEGHQP